MTRRNRTRSWKHNGKRIRKQYGNRDMSKYFTPFMVLDEKYI